MNYVQYEDMDDGASRSVVVPVDLTESTVVEEAVPLLVSAPVPVEAAIFVEIPEGLVDTEFHAAPCDQFVIVLNGVLRTETTDREVRTHLPGAVLRVTDVQGRGHKASVAEGPLRVLFVTIAG